MEDTRFNDEIAPLLIDGETVLGCYQDVRDHVIFTDKIIISVNVQGITERFLHSRLRLPAYWIWTASLRSIIVGIQE